jgi:hypothetical protein
MRTLAAAGSAALLAIAAPALAEPAAAPAAPAPAPALPPKTVSPVIAFSSSEAPKIVSSFPAQGQVIAPGALVLRITFDQPMQENDFSFAAAAGGQMPDCLKTPRLLSDEKSFVLLCTTSAKTAYAMSFNATPHGGFANIGGRRADPAKLAFATNDDDGPRDLDDALKIAKLTRADVPIATQP